MAHNRKIIYFAGFILSLPIALTAYINSSFLEAYVGTYYIGFIYAAASLITIWALFGMPRVLARWGNRGTAVIFSVLTLLSFLGLASGASAYIIISSFILFFLASTFVLGSLDIFIEDFSQSGSIGKFRGFYLIIINSAWVVSQTISGGILAKSSYRGIYIFSALFMGLVVAIFILFLRDFRDPAYKKHSTLKVLRFFWHNKNISAIYIINLTLKFFYAWMVIYSPIYLHEHIGLDWNQIGLIFTIMLTAFFTQYHLGKYSDRHGEKKILGWGFIISGLATLVIPTIFVPSVLIWALVLFITRIGAAMIEVMSESYFFKAVSEENADAIDFFRNTGPLSYLIAPLLAVPILFYAPSFEYIFYVLGAIMLGGFLLTERLKDI